MTVTSPVLLTLRCPTVMLWHVALDRRNMNMKHETDVFFTVTKSK